MFKKILIANRGEIALRIIRACRELGIRTVAVYSQPDANSLHVRFADEAVCIGPAQATQSYLNQPAVLSAVDITGADAVHPGYGFLAENANFAQAVRAMGRSFIGPSVEHLHQFGDKLSAKEAARSAGLPLLEGSGGAVESVPEAIAAAEKAGYPVILKAAGGGGGKGMRVVEDRATLERVFEVAQAESAAAFGSKDVFIERFLRRPRHVEVQVAGDGRGGGIHLGTRDCSMQRRHQKIIEEAPAPNLAPALRERIQEAAATLVRTVKYQTVATAEFLVDGDDFFFLEVNPRIQVEHPVTEEITGVDLIQLQIRLAAGEVMPYRQEEIKQEGHAIEIRVNAEDPFSFLPSPGLVTGYHEPGGPGIRIDSAIHEQAMVQPFYDSLAAKLIVRGRDREHARTRMLWAIDEMVVDGIRTTLPLQKLLLETPEFVEATFWTRFVDEWVPRHRKG
ncbi:MAG: acetyl-CoA carboxylase biotin carboxylase subunit [Alphaproteobacteria bacterium]|nr:acetyl-CoA carboxylase biotin carboxylase subunit [Alphaproteobacteria bacterium]MCB9697881.1 acetyl-CoA carboxylase biotin carboxylase subunit [Alphaproteobacteria bacterium]